MLLNTSNLLNFPSIERVKRSKARIFSVLRIADARQRWDPHSYLIFRKDILLKCQENIALELYCDHRLTTNNI
jgi:hypothetical protein